MFVERTLSYYMFQTLCHPLLNIHLTLFLDVDLSLGMKNFLAMYLNLIFHVIAMPLEPGFCSVHLSVLCLTIQRGDISLDSKCKLLNACLLASILLDNFYSTGFLFIVLINVQKFLVL